MIPRSRSRWRRVRLLPRFVVALVTLAILVPDAARGQATPPPLGSGASKHAPSPVPLPGLITDLGRFAGLDNQQRGDTLIQILRELELDPRVQRFENPRPDWEPRGEGRNLIVSVGNGARTIVVGAHYDAAPLAEGRYTGGVVDNGAAAVILSRVARSLTGAVLRHQVQVVLFDLEEFGLLGSEAFVARTEVADLAAMVNLDIAAYGSTVVYGPGSHDGNAIPYAALRVVCAVQQIPCLESPQYPMSDDRSFQAAGVPNVSIASLEPIEAHQFWLMLNAEGDSGLREGFMPMVGQVIHQEGDRLELADPMAMTRMHDLLVALVLELDLMMAGTQAPPRPPPSLSGPH